MQTQAQLNCDNSLNDKNNYKFESPPNMWPFDKQKLKDREIGHITPDGGLNADIDLLIESDEFKKSLEALNAIGGDEDLPPEIELILLLAEKLEEKVALSK